MLSCRFRYTFDFRVLPAPMTEESTTISMHLQLILGRSLVRISDGVEKRERIAVKPTLYTGYEKTMMIIIREGTSSGQREVIGRESVCVAANVV